ncbi:MAG: hypothetical protein RL215_229, partial [Planctomycetota bacterium]
MKIRELQRVFRRVYFLSFSLPLSSSAAGFLSLS